MEQRSTESSVIEYIFLKKKQQLEFGRFVKFVVALDANCVLFFFAKWQMLEILLSASIFAFILAVASVKL